MYVVAMGLVARLLALAFLSFAVWIPPVSFWENQEAYTLILEGSTLIIIAGVVAYIVSQTNDVFVFHYLKVRDAGRNLLWKRNILSTFLSQFLDSFLFVIIAFGAVLELEQILSIIVGQLVVKWGIALVDTPFVYVLRNLTLGRPTFDFHG